MDILWPQYVEGYRNAGRWTSDDAAAVQGRLDRIADRPAVWISGREDVGVHVSAAPLLRVATSRLVSAEADFILATADGSGGIWLELNDGRWELATWGAFEIPGRGSGESPQKPIS
jgi:hypothetical protein